MDDKILGCKEPYRGDPEQRYEFVKSLGSGGFGTVELCKDRQNHNKYVIRKLSKIDGPTMNEIAILSRIKHKSVVKIYDYYQTQIDKNIIDRNEIKGLKPGTNIYGMVIEYCEGGDFLSYIRERESIEEVVLLKVIDQTAEAIEFLNENRTMHRDIKPENILFDRFGNIKLADFGTGDVLQGDSLYRTFTQQTGTHVYMAPEVKAQHKYYTFAIDVYSLGISIYRACRGDLDNCDLKAIDVDGFPQPIPDQYSDQFKKLIEKMVAFDENDRATLKEIRDIVKNIEKKIDLNEEILKKFQNSLSFFFGFDGIVNKEKAVLDFEKIAEESEFCFSEPVFALAQCYLFGDSVEKDFEKAIKLLRMSSRKIHSPSLKLLSFCYQYGVGVEKDLFTSFQLLSIAQKNDPEASFLLGNLIFNGEEFDIKNKKWNSKLFVKQDFEVAFHYFSNAKNFIPSQNYLGICYLNGKGVESNPFEAYRYFYLAANGGFLDGMYNLAIFYLEQKINDKSFTEKAINLLIEAANNYHLGAAYKLSELYRNGIYVEKDEKKASFYSKMNSKGSNKFDQMYSFAIFKMNGFKSRDNYDEIQKNQYEAFAIFLICSKEHVGATYRLAQCYRDGIGTKKDLSKAADLFEQASKDGIIDATVDLALCFLNGNGRQMDKEKAIELIKNSVDLGSVYAISCLAKCYINCNGVEEDNEKAINLLRQASSSNDLESIYMLAKCLRKKGLNEMNFDILEEAFILFEKAAKKEHPGASYEFAMIFSQGYEIYIDRKKASKFFAIASEKNHPQATTELGKIYELQQNKEMAFKLYNKAANLGDNEGIFHLAMCFLNGVGVEIDKEKSRKLMEKASEQGIADAKLQLGFMYKEGIGGAKDEVKSFKLFEEASNLGNNEAKVQLGKCYLHGIGVQVDNNKAFRMFKQASDNKSNEGKYKLAKLYLKGIGPHKNPNEAILLFEYLVREKNYVPAMYQLGNLYINGIGCDADQKKGVHTLKKAAKSGNKKAMNLLGLCYLNGNGVKTNSEAAFEYFKKAADAGDKDAIENLNKFNKEKAEKTEKTEKTEMQKIENQQQQKHQEKIKNNNNVPLIKLKTSTSVHYINEGVRLPLDQKLPESSRFFGTTRDQKSTRFNQKLPNIPRKQKDIINMPLDKFDSSRKPPRHILYGPMPPTYQKNRSGRRKINQSITSTKKTV